MGGHGNVAFRQAIIILSDNTGTYGDVIMTARLEEHGNNSLFDSTTSLILFAGISRLQTSAFIFIKASPRMTEVVPVPYTAALRAPHPIIQNKFMFDTTKTHSDFICLDSEPEELCNIKEGSLRVIYSDNGEFVTGFMWVCNDITGLEYIDCVGVNLPIRKILLKKMTATLHASIEESDKIVERRSQVLS